MDGFDLGEVAICLLLSGVLRGHDAQIRKLEVRAGILPGLQPSEGLSRIEPGGSSCRCQWCVGWGALRFYTYMARRELTYTVKVD